MQTRLNQFEWKLPQPKTCAETIYYLLLEEEELTRQEIAEKTGLTLHNVCGRVYELKDQGLVMTYKVEGERRERIVLRAWHEIERYDH